MEYRIGMRTIRDFGIWTGPEVEERIGKRNERELESTNVLASGAIGGGETHQLRLKEKVKGISHSGSINSDSGSELDRTQAI